MRRVSTINSISAVLVLAAAIVTQGVAQETGKQTPLESGNIVAVSYLSKTDTTLDLVGTALSPRARGKVEVETREDKPTKIEGELKGLQSPAQFGPEYLTYVLWAVTPEGQSKNLGELRLDGDHADIESSVDFQSFGIVVTAEPYFAVMLPSDAIVAENVLRPETKGKVTVVRSAYELMPHGSYAAATTAEGSSGPVGSPKDPLDLRQARNALHIAQLALADRYASEIYTKAREQLNTAETSYSKDLDKKAITAQARTAVQTAEEARMVATRRMVAEQEEKAKQASVQAEARRRLAAEQARAIAEEQKQAAQQKQAAAEVAKADAQMQARKAQADREAADRAKEDALRAERLAQAQQLQAEAQAIKAKATAEEEARQRLKAETERAELRSKLLRQFNEILPTRETDRGLVVNIGDVLFDLNQYTLRDEARQKLARFAGIVLNYPDLEIRCEGHTDSTGTADYNQALSEDRAQAAADYLSSLGVERERLEYEGLGENAPIASNDSRFGRQKNRRVEMIVSGRVIDVPLSSSSSAAGGAMR